MLKTNFLLLIFSLVFMRLHSQPLPYLNDKSKLDSTEIFSLEQGSPLLLQGKIINGRYYSPKNVFSCEADNFGEKEYITQDGLLEQSVAAAFYNPVGDFKKAEILFIPGKEKNNTSEKDLKRMFKYFGINILTDVDNARDIEILHQEIIEGNMLYTAISVGKMSVLRDSHGNYLQSTRGYLNYPEKDKIIFLSIQKVTPASKEHLPKLNVEKLKKEIIAFSQTFEFGPNPVLEKKESAKL